MAYKDLFNQRLKFSDVKAALKQFMDSHGGALPLKPNHAMRYGPFVAKEITWPVAWMVVKLGHVDSDAGEPVIPFKCTPKKFAELAGLMQSRQVRPVELFRSGKNPKREDIDVRIKEYAGQYGHAPNEHTTGRDPVLGMTWGTVKRWLFEGKIEGYPEGTLFDDVITHLGITGQQTGLDFD